MKHIYQLIVIGGGAAGFFAALKCLSGHPEYQVAILEKSSQLLSKVRISGGGRCNVTHACFEPKQLIQNYPRGGKELLGPFTRFQPKDTIEWFESRGVHLKTEKDGRMFPTTDQSETIIDCLLRESQQCGLEIMTKQRIQTVQKENDLFKLELTSGETLRSKYLLLATGSHPDGHTIAKSFGHTIQELAPSLFTFNIPTSPFTDLAGISVEKAEIHLSETKLSQTGPLLITHWGFSGPAALKLSAWGARVLHAKQYKIPIRVDWLPDVSSNQIIETLYSLRKNTPQQSITAKNPFGLPKNLWKRLMQLADIQEDMKFSEMSNDLCQHLTNLLKQQILQVDGKTTYKEEFVTCGGVTLSEVDFKRMESKLCPGLFFAGEILDIDAVTGGFNFQNAWTTGWLCGQATQSS
jgi:predicted Rossmann fold flavoprotein